MYTEEVEDGGNRRSRLEQEEEEEEEEEKNAGEEEEMEEEVENEEEKNEEVYINIVCKCLPTLLSSVETSTVGLFCRTLAPFARLSRVSSSSFCQHLHQEKSCFLGGYSLG